MAVSGFGSWISPFRNLQSPPTVNMSGGGNVEGYLLKVEGEEVRIVYCMLDEGLLRYFSHMGGELLGAIQLTGAKVEVFLLPDDRKQVPYQFRVDSTPRPTGPRRRRASSGAPVGPHTEKQMFTFAGSSREVADQWAVSVLNWNRYSWEDPQTLCSAKDEFEALSDIVKQSGMKLKTDIVQAPIGVSRAILPL